MVADEYAVEQAVCEILLGDAFWLIDQEGTCLPGLFILAHCFEDLRKRVGIRPKFHRVTRARPLLAQLEESRLIHSDEQDRTCRGHPVALAAFEALLQVRGCDDQTRAGFPSSGIRWFGERSSILSDIGLRPWFVPSIGVVVLVGEVVVEIVKGLLCQARLYIRQQRERLQ
ncbi:hypothetical protein D7Y11_22445 [Corallococcus sp. AB018]|nr:hypothetical protein D7Y11_22445 [Corallococcus sp. AB018]